MSSGIKGWYGLVVSIGIIVMLTIVIDVVQESLSIPAKIWYSLLKKSDLTTSKQIDEPIKQMLTTVHM